MTEHPKTYPSLTRGDGSWGFDAERGKVTLRHRWNGVAYIERGETPQECIVRRDRRRRDADIQASLDGEGTVGGLFDAWLAHRLSAPTRSSTVASWRWSHGHMKRLLGENTPITDVSVGMVEAMYASLIREGMGQSGLGKVRSHLKMALDFGARRSLIPVMQRESLRTAEMPSMRRDANEARWFTLSEYVRVKSHLIEDHSARNSLFLTMLLCGLRPGEALGLKWQFVSLEERHLRVEGQLERHDGGRWTKVLKTDHLHRFAHRTVPIPEELASVLAGLDHRASEFVFIEDRARSRGRLLSYSAAYRHAMIVANRVHVDFLHPNGYRHTFASVCRHNGMPYEQLAKLMGHKDATQIIKTYGHPIVNTSPVDLGRYLRSS